ncbi:MAG: ABC transporter ATP-binding protein [Ruminococcus sp.]|nr:ABC transporter ATP-binding protein [Ruminococcus sp.]
MGKIFKNFLPYWKSVLAVIVLLIIQASCDLALPQYTSNIIDTGIQNSGIEHILPEKMSANEYEYAQLFMKDKEIKLFKKAYEKDGGYYTLSESGRENAAELDEQLIIPIMMDYSMSMLPVDTFKEMLSSQTAGDNPTSPSTNYDDISVEDIGKLFGVELKPFTRVQSDADGNETEVECIDTRPLFCELVAGAQLSLGGEMVIPVKIEKDKLLQSRKSMENEIDALGADTMMSSGIAFAAKCDREAGVDVDVVQTNYLWTSGFKMLAIALVLTVASILVGYFASRVGASVGMDMRSKVFKNVIGFSNAEIDKFSTASLITRTTNDIQQIQMVAVMLLRMVLYAPIIGIGGVIKVINTGASMWWVIALAVAAIMIVVLTLMGVAMPKFKLMQKLVDRVNLVSREILTGIPVIRAFGREKQEEERFDEANKELTKTTLFTNRVMTFMMPIMTVLMNLVSVLIVWVAAGHINDGNMQVGEMTAFITYSMQIIISFLMLTMMSIMLPRAAVAAGRIDEVVNTKSTITDSENAEELKSHDGVVEFKNVAFRYPGAEENVLEGISFRANPGETTAIIGSTGSGKSTLVNLIPRLYDVTEGEISVDGKDIRSLTMQSLRDEIGYVPQKGILFSGTIESNLKFGNKNATQKDMENAAEIAQATEFIEQKHDKYQSEIAQGGTNVSGGQKQRLSIARAIAKNPKIYIFDDSFSALDMKTDAVLRKALSESVSDSTVIIVAQRISTIMDAEQIIVLDEGKIAGIGTHEELLRSCDSYLEIAKSQLSEKELGLGKDGESNG